MIPNSGSKFCKLRCIPRESGDDPGLLSEAPSGVLYSPRERG